MNDFHTPRTHNLAALACAVLMTLATLLGVGQLAAQSHDAVQMANATSATAKA